MNTSKGLKEMEEHIESLRKENERLNRELELLNEKLSHHLQWYHQISQEEAEKWIRSKEKNV